jgi:hypothetical protein
METIIINKKEFDYSPSLQAYVNRDLPTLTLVWDGKNVVPLQAYEISRTRTVAADGSISQTDTVKILQQHEQAKQEYQVAVLQLGTQLARVGVSFSAVVLIIAVACAAYLGWAFTKALAARSAEIMVGPALALTEIAYLITWVIGGALSLAALYFIARWLIGLAAGSESAAPDLQVRYTPTPPAAEKQTVSININQGGAGYNAAQNYVQGN